MRLLARLGRPALLLPAAAAVGIATSQPPATATSDKVVIAAGTGNQCKLAALRAALASTSQPGCPTPAGLRYRCLRDREVDIQSASVESGVSDQPMTMEETLRGASNRAKAALEAVQGAELGVGMESGLFAVDGMTFDTCACVVVDRSGRRSVGWSCAFQIPPHVMDLLRSGEATDLTIACNKGGISNDPELGKHQGMIGLMSDMRLSRQAYTEQAVVSAMIGVDNKSTYLNQPETEPTTDGGVKALLSKLGLGSLSQK